MSKIRALYINEMIKTSKKISILVMAIILILGTIGFGGLMKLQESMAGQYSTYGDDEEWMREEMHRMINDNEDSLEDFERQLEKTDKDSDPAGYQSLLEQIDDVTAYKDMLELALEQNIMVVGNDNYLTQTLYKTVEIKQQLRGLAQFEDNESSAEYTRLELLLEDYNALIKNRSFESYIELSKEAAASNPTLNDSAKQTEAERLDLWYKLDPTGGIEQNDNSYYVQETLSRYTSLKNSIADGVDYTSYEGIKPLTPARFSELENELAVLIYSSNNDLNSQESSYSLASTALSGMISFGTSMIVLMILILAGGAISQEIATGSIKSLIIAPVKRWKIFIAKLLSLLTVSILAMIVHFVIVILFYGLFFGFDSLPAYIYAINGQANALGPVLYLIASQAVRLVDVVVFLAFALMLSVLTRNTAVAVGISMASFFGVSVAKQMMMLLPAAEWVKFMPFDHINLTEKIFPFAQNSMNYYMTNQNETSLLFSVIYIIVALFCMLYTALDSFSRRDIK